MLARHVSPKSESRMEGKHCNSRSYSDRIFVEFLLLHASNLGKYADRYRNAQKRFKWGLS